MKLTTLTIAGILIFAMLQGCGSSDVANKPPTKDDIKAFKGNPTAPELQRALRAHFGAQAPPAAAAGSQR